MNWQEFAASVIGSLAWPISAGILVWLLRDHLKTLFDRQLLRLKVGPIEAEWPAVSADVSKDVLALRGTAPDTNASKDAAFSDEIEQLVELAEMAPVAAVGTGWRLVEREIRATASDAGVEDPITTPLSRLLPHLSDGDLIGREIASAVQGLYALSRIAAHDDGSGLSVTPERALEFVVLLDDVVRALRRSRHARR